MKKRALAFMAAFMLISQLIACAGESMDSTPSSQTAITTSVTIAEPEETVVPLGIEPEDNGGRDFHILVPTEKSYEFVTESNGEVVNDAMLVRSQKVEELLNIKFSYQYELGGWDTRDAHNKIITGAVLAGDSAYDIATGYIVCTMPLYMNGVFLDLMKIPEINLENLWWMRDQFSNLNTAGKLFCVFGDGNLSVYKDCSITYFNKQVLEDYNLDNPYELVRNSQWTMPKMLEMSEAVKADLNGDSKIDKDNDRIGAYGQGVPMRAFQTGLDIKIFDTDESGNRFVVGLTDRLVKRYEYVNSFHNRDDLYAEYGAVDFPMFTSILAENRALFHFTYISVLEGDVMRNMQADFGLIPYPKFDESQEKYKAQIGTATNVMFMPKTASDTALSGKVMEALNYYSMIDVIPTYYTVALQQKYTRDADVPEMLDIIREGMTMDYAFAYSTCFSDPWPNTVIIQQNKDIASYIAKAQPKWEKDIQKLIEKAEEA